MRGRLLVTLLAAAHLCLAVPARAADPAPTTAAPVATSGKPPLGCCCFPKQGSDDWGCDWGLSEAKCKVASEALKLPSKWTEGKCPRKQG